MDAMPLVSAPVGHLAEPDLESLSARVKRGDQKAIPALAKQFEGMFMAQLVKEMRQTLEPGTLFGNDPGDVYGGLFDMFMGKHLAAAGGIGIAKVLEKSMSANAKAHAAAPANAAPPTNTPTSSGPWKAAPHNSPTPA